MGKSRMMRERIVPEWIRRGRPVVVLDPLNQPWNATIQTTDPDEWLATMKRSRGCIGVWDECGSMCYADPKLASRLNYAATIARNDGHLVYFLSQRLYMVPLVFRLQCSWGYLFRLRGNDPAHAFELFPEPGLPAALPRLNPGECIHIKPLVKPVKIRVF